MIEVVDPNNKKPNVVAISSLCEDGLHCIFWDFDFRPNLNTLRKVEDSLMETVDRYSLSNAFILESRNGYNAICTNKLPFQKVFNIKLNTAFDDEKHNVFGYEQNHWRLRLGDDKKMVSFIRNPNYKYPKSNPHRIYLNKFYRCDLPKDRFYDDYKNCLVVGYWSWKEECIIEKKPFINKKEVDC